VKNGLSSLIDMPKKLNDNRLCSYQLDYSLVDMGFGEGNDRHHSGYASLPRKHALSSMSGFANEDTQARINMGYYNDSLTFGQ